jgi:hypothetical protein
LAVQFQTPENRLKALLEVSQPAVARAGDGDAARQVIERAEEADLSHGRNGIGFINPQQSPITEQASAGKWLGDFFNHLKFALHAVELNAGYQPLGGASKLMFVLDPEAHNSLPRNQFEAISLMWSQSWGLNIVNPDCVSQMPHFIGQSNIILNR